MSDERTVQSVQPSRQSAPLQVQGAIAQASTRTGVDFGYLLAQAKVESGLDADAKARTSSASGLFQFIESTWLDVMQRHGPSYGLGEIASEIGTGPRGPRVENPLMRGKILALRNDPQIASLMAGALAQDNRDALMPVLGREPDGGELYLAHFLGSSGAGKFLTAMQQDPDAPAAGLFGKAASANRAIFYGQGGKPRSLSGVMDLLRGKIEAAMPNGGPIAPVTGGGAPVWSELGGPSFGGARQASARFSSPSFAEFGNSMGADLPTTLPKLSSILQDSFGFDGTPMAGAAGDHARRAYAKLKAFGL